MRLPSIVFLALLAGLSACGPSNKVYSYQPIETPGGRLCAMQCRDAQGYCTENCNVDQRLCTNKVQSQALDDYDKYTRQQFIDHQPIELHASDFERMTPCTDAKKSCAGDCESAYRSCYESCGGKVDVSSACQFFCF